jgi:hypothetical protein
MALLNLALMRFNMTRSWVSEGVCRPFCVHGLCHVWFFLLCFPVCSVQKCFVGVSGGSGMGGFLCGQTMSSQAHVRLVHEVLRRHMVGESDSPVGGGSLGFPGLAFMVL